LVDHPSPCSSCTAGSNYCLPSLPLPSPLLSISHLLLCLPCPTLLCLLSALLYSYYCPLHSSACSMLASLHAYLLTSSLTHSLTHSTCTRQKPQSATDDSDPTTGGLQSVRAHPPPPPSLPHHSDIKLQQQHLLYCPSLASFSCPFVVPMSARIVLFRLPK